MRRLDTVKIFVRIATILGIAYLLTAGGMFMAAAQEARHFHNTAPVFEGEVISVRANAGEGGLLSRLRLGRGQTVVISYAKDQASGQITADMPARRHMKTGDKVALVGSGLDSPDPLNHVVSVKGHGLRTLQAVPVLFWMAAGIVAWVVFLRVVPWRRRTRPALEKAAADHTDEAETL